jgi:hypothetical protein
MAMSFAIAPGYETPATRRWVGGPGTSFFLTQIHSLVSDKNKSGGEAFILLAVSFYLPQLPREARH